MGIPEGDIINLRESSKMDTAGYVDEEQTTEVPNDSDGSMAMSQA